MASGAAEAAAAVAFPDRPGLQVAVRNAFREAFASGYDAGKAQANSDAGWSANIDRQGGA